MQNVDNIRMVNISEPIFQCTETVNEYDITYIDNTSFKFYKENYKDSKSSGEPNLYAYHIKLMLKIGETSPLKRERFINYQISIHKDPLTWLIEIDDLINQNYYQFEDKPTRWESFENFREIIQQKVEEIENPKAVGESDFNQPKTKIKTKLNIYELSYLFKVLDECDFFEMNNKTDLFRAISETFETKRQTKEDLNIESIASKFYSKDPKAIESLHLKFRKMQEIAFEDKKNIGV